MNRDQVLLQLADRCLKDVMINILDLLYSVFSFILEKRFMKIRSNDL